jgi:BirA family biotin operon repressor/biotin-[acetyl-CoA-carboxylase] ligase
VWAERQTAGRGRAGRAWTSPPGGVYCSLVVRPTRPAPELPQLALVAGLGVAEALTALGLAPAIRWPNDVLIDGLKVCGILAEASTDPQGRPYAVVGFGLNVTTDPSALPETAASLARWLAPAPDRVVLAADVLRAVDRVYRRWHRDGLAAIRHDLVRHGGWVGRIVQITTPRDAFQGQAVDLDDGGRLLVRLDSGIVRAVEMGEVTLLR